MTRTHQMTNYKLWTNCIYPTVLKAICLYVYGLKKYKLRAIFLLTQDVISDMRNNDRFYATFACKKVENQKGSISDSTESLLKN